MGSLKTVETRWVLVIGAILKLVASLLYLLLNHDFSFEVQFASRISEAILILCAFFAVWLAGPHGAITFITFLFMLADFTLYLLDILKVKTDLSPLWNRIVSFVLGIFWFALPFLLQTAVSKEEEEKEPIQLLEQDEDNPLVYKEEKSDDRIFDFDALYNVVETETNITESEAQQLENLIKPSDDGEFKNVYFEKIFGDQIIILISDKNNKGQLTLNQGSRMMKDQDGDISVRNQARKKLTKPVGEFPHLLLKKEYKPQYKGKDLFYDFEVLVDRGKFDFFSNESLNQKEEEE